MPPQRMTNEGPMIDEDSALQRQAEIVATRLGYGKAAIASIRAYLADPRAHTDVGS